MALPIDHKFECEFETNYERNNKSAGRKNIRCFPDHTERGHVGNRFCGTSVSISINSQHQKVMHQIPGMVFISEIALRTQDNSILPQLIEADHTVDLAIIEEHVCSREHPTNPLMMGIMSGVDVSAGVATAEFNREKMSWHYGWPSSKGAHKALHCYQVHVLVPVMEVKSEASSNNSKRYHVLSSFQSSPFTIVSRRRGTRTQPTAKGSKPVPKPIAATTQQQQQQQPPSQPNIAMATGDVDDDGPDALLRKRALDVSTTSTKKPTYLSYGLPVPSTSPNPDINVAMGIQHLDLNLNPTIMSPTSISPPSLSPMSLGAKSTIAGYASVPVMDRSAYEPYTSTQSQSRAAQAQTHAMPSSLPQDSGASAASASASSGDGSSSNNSLAGGDRLSGHHHDFSERSFENKSMSTHFQVSEHPFGGGETSGSMTAATTAEERAIDFKVSKIIRFIFGGGHLSWLADKGANPNKPCLPRRKETARGDSKPPSPNHQQQQQQQQPEDHSSTSAEDHLRMSEAWIAYDSNAIKSNRPPQPTPAKDKDAPFLEMTDDVMGSISSDLLTFWEDGRFDAKRKAAMSESTQEGGPPTPPPKPKQGPTDDGAIDTMMFPLDDPASLVDMDIRMDALLDDVRDDARISILQLVDHIFEDVDLHEKITQFFQDAKQKSQAVELVRQWNQGVEERRALKQFSSWELDQSQGAWMNLSDRASTRDFLGCAIVALRRLVVDHVADYLQRNGCMLDMFDLDDATSEDVDPLGGGGGGSDGTDSDGVEDNTCAVPGSKEPWLLKMEEETERHLNNPSNVEQQTDGTSQKRPASYVKEVPFVVVFVRRLGNELRPSLEASLPYPVLASPESQVFDGMWKIAECLEDFKEAPMAAFASKNQMPHINPMMQRAMPKIHGEFKLRLHNGTLFVDSTRFLMAYSRVTYHLDGVPRPILWCTPFAIADFSVSFSRSFLVQNYGAPGKWRHGLCLATLVYMLDEHNPSPAKMRMLATHSVDEEGVLHYRTRIFVFIEPVHGLPPRDLDVFLQEDHPRKVADFSRMYKRKAFNLLS